MEKETEGKNLTSFKFCNLFRDAGTSVHAYCTRIHRFGNLRHSLPRNIATGKVTREFCYEIPHEILGLVKTKNR